MTVGIAAICQWSGVNMVVGASDRMLTVDDSAEYEPPTSKIFFLTPRAVALIAGDTSSQFTIAIGAQKEIVDRPATDIKDIAAIYAKHFAAHRLKEAEALILAPLGLTGDTFLKRQKTMAPDIVRDITYKLLAYELDAEAIIAGMDQAGAHIYTIRDPGLETCQDRVGFAAIGIGGPHAESQFMFAKYSPFTWYMPWTLFLTYFAKKRAEVAPGVGQETDMFFIESGTPNASYLFDQFKQSIDGIYRNMHMGMDRLLQEGGRLTLEEHQKLRAAEAEKQKAASAEGETEQSALTGGVGEGVEKGQHEDQKPQT